MDFLDIGAGELLLVLILVLILFGPNKIPEIARTLGKVMHDIRKASFDLTNAVTREVEAEKKNLVSQNADQSKSASNQGNQPVKQPEPPKTDRTEQ